MSEKDSPERRKLMEIAEKRGRLTGLRQRLVGDATRKMLEAAHLKRGDQVLDIAAGTGDQSRQAAALVGPEGSILATDISPEFLEVADRLAQQEGLSNITTRVMNAEQLDLADNQYDAVISRFGLMLIHRKQQALSEIRRVLKPGGWLAALVWSTREHNPLLALEEDIDAKTMAGQKPEEHWGDPFSLADPAFFARALTEAGFRQVQVESIERTFHFLSFEELSAWWGPPFDRLMAELEPEPRQRQLEEIRQAVRPFEVPQGIQAPGEFLLGVGMK